MKTERLALQNKIPAFFLFLVKFELQGARFDQEIISLSRHQSVFFRFVSLNLSVRIYIFIFRVQLIIIITITITSLPCYNCKFSNII